MLAIVFTACHALEDGELPPVEVPSDAPFVRVRTSSVGICDPRGPCGSYRELWGEGTLRWRSGDERAPSEAHVEPEDVEALAAIALDEELLALLRGGGCQSYTMDYGASTLVETWDEPLSASTNGCEDEGLDALHARLDELVTLAE